MSWTFDSSKSNHRVFQNWISLLGVQRMFWYGDAIWTTSLSPLDLPPHLNMWGAGELNGGVVDKDPGREEYSVRQAMSVENSCSLPLHWIFPLSRCAPPQVLVVFAYIHTKSRDHRQRQKGHRYQHLCPVRHVKVLWISICAREGG